MQFMLLVCLFGFFLFLQSPEPTMQIIPIFSALCLLCSLPSAAFLASTLPVLYSGLTHIILCLSSLNDAAVACMRAAGKGKGKWIWTLIIRVDWLSWVSKPSGSLEVLSYGRYSWEHCVLEPMSKSSCQWRAVCNWNVASAEGHAKKNG